MIRPKRSSVTQEIADLLKGMHLSSEVDLAGHTWRLGTLDPSESIEADGLVADFSSMQAGRSYARAVLAYALTHIDGKPIEEHFAWPERPAAATEEQAEWDAIDGNADAKRRWYRAQVYDFVIHDLQDEVIAELFKAYAQLSNQKKNNIEALPGFLKRMPTTASSPT